MSSDLIFTQRQSDEVKVNSNTSKAVAQSQVQLPFGGLEIIHATSGRVRIRTIDGSFNSSLESISERLRQQYGVREVAVNQQTGSIVVTFDEKKLSLAQVLRLLEQFGIHQVQASPESVSNKDPFAAWKSIDFWKEQSISFIPLMTGLAVTGRLGISGLAAIPVYMITADATRRVIDFVGSQVSVTEEEDKQTRKTPPLAQNLRQEKEAQNLGGQEDKENLNISSAPSASSTPPAYSVVHAIEGRIRFHLPLLALDRAYARRLERLVKTDPQVLSVRVNDHAASIAIAYCPGKIEIAHWVSLMELALHTNPPTNLVKTTELQPPPKPVTQSAESIETRTEETLNLSSLWADLKPSALSYSLAFMANFPL
ncbi:HMA2 domain-containing protein [Nostoc sp. UHCC 0302]|uniref:HMA2 domain-containing protein n=1 Tax=Nostoc sp. UHCC 0302 TaxID=3134896 RepID=UPI00311CAD4F